MISVNGAIGVNSAIGVNGAIGVSGVIDVNGVNGASGVSGVIDSRNYSHLIIPIIQRSEKLCFCTIYLMCQGISLVP